MKEVTKYVCERCGEMFDSEDDCKKHEDRHSPVDCIAEAYYDYSDSYPHAIKVRLKSGVEIVYRSVG